MNKIIKNVSQIKKIYLGKEIEPQEEFSIPSEYESRFLDLTSLQADISSGDIRIIKDGQEITDPTIGLEYFLSTVVLEQIVFQTPDTVVNSNDPGYKGYIRWDSNYIYICVEDNIWKRIPLQSW